jgi:hypothetical protein
MCLPSSIEKNLSLLLVWQFGVVLSENVAKAYISFAGLFVSSILNVKSSRLQIHANFRENFEKVIE